MSDPFKDALRKMSTCPDCKNDLVCHDQGECLRPTPETDSAFEEFRETCDLSNLEKEMADIERQRNEAREAFAIATDQLVQVQSELRQAREENARLREALQRIADCTDAPDIDPVGEIQLGLHCGVEDSDCTDRYNGADYGFACGTERALEWASNEAKHALTP